jgi:hypothetical protein
LLRRLRAHFKDKYSTYPLQGITNR